MTIALLIAAALVLLACAAHSYLGERYLLKRLFQRKDLPKLMGNDEFAMRTLRFAWHITSLAWLGFAALLALLAYGSATPRAVGLVIGGTFFMHGAVALIASRGKHLSWIAFFAIALLVLYAFVG
jgi:hypothetical protein